MKLGGQLLRINFYLKELILSLKTNTIICIEFIYSKKL